MEQNNSRSGTLAGHMQVDRPHVHHVEFWFACAAIAEPLLIFINNAVHINIGKFGIVLLRTFRFSYERFLFTGAGNNQQYYGEEYWQEALHGYQFYTPSVLNV